MLRCVAYNPSARAKKAREAAIAAGEEPASEAPAAGDGWEGSGGSEADRDKRYHLNAIAEALGCAPTQCMLIDDMP